MCSLYAVDLKTGKTSARWRPEPLQAAHGERAEPWLFEQDGQLYLMTRQEFSEINFDDLAAKKRGWN
jgi:hypothetical protein